MSVGQSDMCSRKLKLEQYENLRVYLNEKHENWDISFRLKNTFRKNEEKE